MAPLVESGIIVRPWNFGTVSTTSSLDAFFIVMPDTPHLSAPELAGHAAHRLAAADILRVSDHLAACVACREAFAHARQSPPARPGEFLDGPESGAPTFEELEGEIAGTLSPAQHESLAIKLAESPAAREALADLAAFRAQLDRLPVKHHDPSAPGRIETAPVENGKIISPPAWRWRGPLGQAAALAALFLGIAVAWWMLSPSGQESADLLREARGRTADLAGLPAALRESVEAALRTGSLPLSPALPLVTGREKLAGTVAEAVMATEFPVGIVVRETRPTLRWTPLADAASYRVSIVATAGGAVLSSPLLPAAQTRWTPPEALVRGETYNWQVAALRDGRTIDRAPKPPAGEARFRVLDAARDAELSRVEGQAAGNPLILGVAYWRAGMTDAAGEQFHRLAQAHARSAVAQRLERAAADGRRAE